MRSLFRTVAVLTVLMAALGPASPRLSSLPFGAPGVAAEELDMAGVKVNVIERKLENGLTLVMVENHQSPTVGLISQFAVGSVDEWDGISGSAHILEHLLFKGTPTLGTSNWAKEKALLADIEKTAQDLRWERSREFRSDPARLTSLEARLDSLQESAREYVVSNELDRIYQEAGGQSVNAGTSWDWTNYQVALPSNRLELWMKLESDRLKEPILREFYTELKNIREERRMGVDDEPAGPLGMAAEALYATAFTAHRYGVPIIGWPSDIDKVTRSEVEAFFKKYYAPNRMTLAIVGDIDPEKTFEMVKAYFGPIPRQPEPFMPRTVEPEQRGERRVVVEYEAEPRVLIGWHVPAGLHPDFPALLVLHDILTGGRSSRLDREIVENKKIAATITGYTGIPGERYPNLYVLESTPLSPHTTAEVEAAIYDVIEGVKKGPISDRELETAKTKYRKDFVDGLIDNLGLAQIMAANQATLGDWREGFKRAEAVAQVTAADVQRVATTYLKASNRTVSTLVKPAAETSFVDPADQEKAAALLAGAIKSLGGAKALGGIKDVRTEATISITTPAGAIEGTSKEVITADNRLRNEMSIMGQNQVQSYDGDKAWIITAAGAQEAPAEMADDLRTTMTRQRYLWSFDPARVTGTLKTLPDVEFNGVMTHAIEITPPGTKPFVIHLDKETHLPVGQTFDTKNPLTGQSGRAEVLFSDYRTVSGVQFPGKTSFRMGGQTIVEETVKEITVNTGVKPEEFRRSS
jgi:predicted Zn-dependent peptidase